MVEQHTFIASILSPTDALSEETRSLSDVATSSTSSYPDLIAYSAVSPFTVSTQCESNLLTPISTADSPPLQQNHKFMVGQYPPPPESPHGQEPTPPGSTKMYHQWGHHHFEMSHHASQGSSPMHTPGHMAPDFYMADRRTPGPPEPYMGSYSVSNASQHGSLSQSDSPYYLEMPQLHSQSSLLLRGNAPMPLGPGSRELDRDMSMPAPLLHDAPRTSPCRRPGRLDSTEMVDTADRQSTEVLRSSSDSPRKRAAVIGNNRVKKLTGRRKSRKNMSQSQPTEEHTNCNGEQVPPTLKETCPDEERCIFESRWRHRNKRGQDMWDSIQSDFYKKFNKSHGKEMLQMKFRRARSKYIEWLPKDEEILRDAWKKVEQERYQLILDTFLDMGGSRNMRLNSSDIEVKLVNDLKIEEHLYMDCFQEIDVRRRKKLSSRKRSGGGDKGHDDAALGSDVMSLEPRHAHDDDEVINQVHQPRSARWETSPASHVEMIDMQMWEGRGNMKIEPPSAPHRLLNNMSGRAMY
ncbi:uncharacterized protein UV8b_04194 [Ustilaginoidea virens]|uniref:Uncharacterized protein n=1 Tax=Ustilaginoidea virens TaxID=1159556 RepID=A0A8E5MGX5_USTVR|nr:uncharacterized protein UV8b_04194 [Ustilaginoidea virens]QUC19953.1 hypothetical protein UV8b_04194 [Ustilaginoidea virens]